MCTKKRDGLSLETSSVLQTEQSTRQTSSGYLSGWCGDAACCRVSTQIWSRVEHALNRQDALNTKCT